MNRALASSWVISLALVAGCGNDATGSGASLGVAVSVDPSLAFYPVASQVSLTATVIDGEGTRSPGTNMVWTFDPPDAATPSGEPGAFTLNKVGHVTFTACTADDGSSCGRAMIEVSPGAPLLVVTTPQPGAELGGDGASTFPVEGKITSGRATNVFINGIPAAVAPDGTFKTELAATFGVNHVVVSADNGEDPEVRRELDVAFGASYAAAVDAQGAPAFSAPDAIVLDLGQRFFDDGTAVPLSAPHPVALPDVADIVARVVAGMDIASSLPNPLIASSGVNLTVTSATAGDVTVETQLAGDGLDLFVRVGKLTLGSTGSLDLSGTPISLDGGIEASLSAYAHASITKASPGAPVVVTVGTFDVALETAKGKFTDPQANAIFALASGFLRTTVESMVKAALADALQGSVPQALESVFESLDTALANSTFNVDAAPLPKIVLTLDGHLDELAIAPLESLRAKLSLAVKTDHTTALHPKSRGVALVDTSTQDAFFESPRSQLSVRLAVLNGLLHNLWNSGLLEVPATDAIPVSVSAQLPPIVRLPRAGETDDLVVSLGELEMLPRGDEANGRLGVLFEAGVSIDLVDNTLRLKVADKPALTVWTIKAPAGASFFTPQVLSDLLLSGLWPKLHDGIANALTIKLPLPPLGAIASVAPSLSGLALTTGLNRRVTYRNGFLVLDAKLEGTLP